MKKFTAIYTESVGNYGATIVKMVRLTQHDHETIVQAVNRVGYETQQEGWNYDIFDSVVFLFEGHPQLEGETNPEVNAIVKKKGISLNDRLPRC